MTIDYDRLRADLVDYCGTAGTAGMPAAFVEAMNIRTDSNAMLVDRAKQYGIDLAKYVSESDMWKR
jgi:hypothetical protein